MPTAKQGADRLIAIASGDFIMRLTLSTAEKRWRHRCGQNGLLLGCSFAAFGSAMHSGS
jgi:hypothetical protein